MDWQDEVKKTFENNSALIESINGQPKEIKIIFPEKEPPGLILRTECEEILSQVMNGNNSLSVDPIVNGKTLTLTIRKMISDAEAAALVNLFENSR